MKIFLVGGAVRDKLLGLEPSDRDFVVVGAKPEDMINAGFEQVGMGFPVFLHPTTREEYALARREKKVGLGYTGFEFDTSTEVTLVEDLERRDLTINSMAEDLDGSLIDPFGGLADLRQRVLRHTSMAFVEDPLRVVRLARFFARYETFTIADETMELATQVVDSGELDELPDERFWRELDKVFGEGADLGRFFGMLHEVDALRKVDFFKRLFGENCWDVGHFSHIVRVANGSLTWEPELRAGMFGAVVAPEEPIGLFHLARAAHAHRALWLVRSLPKAYTALDVLNLLSKIRAFASECKHAEDLVKVMTIACTAGEWLPLSPKKIANAVAAGRYITSEPFQHLTGKAIGDAMAQARVVVIKAALDL